MSTSIYLSGGNVDSQDLLASTSISDWRSLAMNKLHRYGLRVVNPLEFAWSMDGAEPMSHIPGADTRVRHALELIDQSDAVLANLTRASYATAMEIFYAHRRGKMVTVIGQSPFNPWVLSHSQARFEDVDKAVDYLIDEQPHAAPLNWALQYEANLSERYEQFPPPGEPDYQFLGGHIPIMVMAPHATAYWREGEFQEPDTFTGSMAAALHRMSGCHSLITSYCCAADPCHYLETPFRRAFADMVKSGQIGLVVMLLGLSWHEAPGLNLTGWAPTLHQIEDYLTRLRLKLSKFEPVSSDVSERHVRPLLRFVSEELKVPTLVLKLHKRYRMPRLQGRQFMQLAGEVSEFISECGEELCRMQN